MIKFFIFFFSFYIVISYADNLCHGIPDNDWQFPEGLPTAAPKSQAEYDAILDDFYEVYQLIFKAKGLTFVIERRYSDSTVNAYAQLSGSTAKITMMGGIYRASSNAMGFAMVTAHEISHLIGSYPRYNNNSDWASVEGESDYAGALKVMRRVYKGTEYNSGTDEMEDLCRKSFTSEIDLNMCMRSLDGGQSLGDLLASLGGSSTPSLSKTDSKVVTTTQESHPQAQCRLDSYRNGALCSVDEKIELSSTEEKTGACIDKNYRPLCWFKPKASTPEEPSDIPPTPIIGSHSSGLVFTYDSDCKEILFEVKATKFSTPNAEKEDKRSYLGIWNNVGSDSFIISRKYFKRGTNYTRYFCYDRGVIGKASNAVKFKRN